MEEKKVLSKEIIDSYRKLDTASISDAMDRHGIPCGMLGIKAVTPGVKAVGQAFTVHYTKCGEIHGTVGDFLDDVAPGEIVVIDNGGRLNCTVWGDIMSFYSHECGIEGTIIDGVCRDVPTILELQYPIFTKGTFMVTGKDRVYVDGINVPVSISDIQVLPGDLIVADESGAVRVPFSMAETILEEANMIEQKEEKIRQEIKKGNKLKDARKITGYHNLQTKR